DEDDRVIRPAKLWCDTATVEEARELSRAFERRVPVGYTASKILWLVRHEPEHWKRVRHVLLPHDYINFVLSGQEAMELGDASGTGLVDPVRREIRDTDLAAIDPGLAELLPPLLGPGEFQGRVSREGARLTGLGEGIPVAAGGGDNMMSAIGSGATRPGVVVMSLGTSGTVFSYSEQPVVDPEGLIAPFCDSTGAWLPLLCVMNMILVSGEVAEAFGTGLDELTEEAGSIAPGSEGVFFLPYLQGERVPDLPRATGSILGLRPGLLRRGVLFRAALEGTSFYMAWGFDRLRGLGVAVRSLRLAGGAARNPLWCQILADVLDAPLALLAERESAALGAAIQALWTRMRLSGDARSAHEIAAPFIRLEKAGYEPDPDRVLRYRQLGAEFRELAERVYGVRGP
ncbi:MAG: xylulokinase, partial [Planctomycetota bacterium]